MILITTVQVILLLVGASLSAQNDELKPGDRVNFLDKDLRIVQGIRVDLLPVHTWFSTHEGERPLPHWRQIQVFQIKEKSAGAWHRCMVKNEDGTFVEILIANLPERIVTYFNKRSILEARIAQLRQQIEVEERVAKEADAVTPTGVMGPACYVEETMDQRYQVNLALEKIRQKKVDLANFEVELTTLRNSGTEVTKEFAMFTGRKQGDPEIWECGYKPK